MKILIILHIKQNQTTFSLKLYLFLTNIYIYKGGSLANLSWLPHLCKNSFNHLKITGIFWTLYLTFLVLNSTKLPHIRLAWAHLGGLSSVLTLQLAVISSLVPVHHLGTSQRPHSLVFHCSCIPHICCIATSIKTHCSRDISSESCSLVI